MVCTAPIDAVVINDRLDSSDEVFKSAAYMTDTYLLSRSQTTRAGTDPTKAPFCFAFGTIESQIGYFGWLDGLFGEQNLDQGFEETGFVLSYDRVA